MWWIYTTIPLRYEFKDSDQVEHQKVCDTKVVFLINLRGWNINCTLTDSSTFVLCTLTFDLDVFHLHFVFEESWSNTRGLGEQCRDAAWGAGYNRMDTGSERTEDDLKYSQGQSALPWKRWYPNQLSVFCFCVWYFQRTKLSFSTYVFTCGITPHPVQHNCLSCTLISVPFNFSKVLLV